MEKLREDYLFVEVGEFRGWLLIATAAGGQRAVSQPSEHAAAE